MDVSFVVKHRLEQLGLEQRDLARASDVTESYISQLLTRKKAPPAPNRTDIYEKMEAFLRLPGGELAKLADLERQEELKKTLAAPPQPLLKESRDLILSKCKPDKQKQVKAIFEKQPLGELERLVTQKLLDVAKRVAKEELDSENWVRLVARMSNRSYEDVRVAILEFLDANVFELSKENRASFLGPLIESWDVDLNTFGMEIILNRRVTLDSLKRFEFVEREPGNPIEVEPGLKEFLKDPALSADASDEEVEFLKSLRFKDRRPAPLYYYRELQSLRDPLHFRAQGGKRRG